MAFSPHAVLARFFNRRAVARWRLAANAADTADLTVLGQQQHMASQLLRPLQRLTETAESRLALPRAGSTTFPRPPGTDWSWRPKPWRVRLPEKGLAPALSKTRLGGDLRIFHDCKNRQISLRQIRNSGSSDLAPFGLSLEVLRFTGDYLSLVIEVPPAACEGLRKKHLIRLAAVIEREQPTKIDARLNILNGPNTEQILLTLPDDTADTMVEFDLAYGQLNEKRAERMWIDLMIAAPHMNKIVIRDLNLARYPRAEI
ncbi:DUF6478 family protein [Loktanella sp. Alg231-35]|uniref:DUF6478 family protein n=1 Tax=Loktanella sp. Alg231-35 TaxID=1922220 RepID=UPI000D5614E5|nr:DUF6478 family protein [Loktanella sp. Alg231-35]